MLPAIFMGLKEGKFKNFNNLIKNKNFVNSLLDSVLSTKYFLAKKKFNSVILNYDELSIDLFQWYQQLIAESLGKNSKGISIMSSKTVTLNINVFSCNNDTQFKPSSSISAEILPPSIYKSSDSDQMG